MYALQVYNGEGVFLGYYNGYDKGILVSDDVVNVDKKVDKQYLFSSLKEADKGAERICNEEIPSWDRFIDWKIVPYKYK